MEVKTYQARSIQEALALVRNDLGPDASVLHTREVRRGMLSWLSGSRRIEVTASATINVPSRFSQSPEASSAATRPLDAFAPQSPPQPPEAAHFSPADQQDHRDRFRESLKGQWAELDAAVDDFWTLAPKPTHGELPESLFRLYTDLIDAEVAEESAREWVDRVRTGATPGDLEDTVLLKARIARMLEEEIKVSGPIQVTPGQRRVVALVGPTGVGKTTTIAKLAANFRLRERRRVGLITVDTYRIAAVDQLRTYADIIDLPMEVVSTPREMREAVERLSKLDLILLDTAGRSPSDEVKIQELKSMLSEAQADETHLVLSSVSSIASLKKTAERFAKVGVTSLLLTKLDEATGLGGVLPLLRSCKLPISYVTNGQNVPDDIESADRRKLASRILGMDIES